MQPGHVGLARRQSFASCDEDSEPELKNAPGQMHVSGRKKDRAVPRLGRHMFNYPDDGGGSVEYFQSRFPLVSN